MLDYMKECILHSSRFTVPLLIVLAVAAGTFLWPLSYGPSVYAQDPTETPTPAPTDTPPPTNTPPPTATATPIRHRRLLRPLPFLRTHWNPRGRQRLPGPRRLPTPRCLRTRQSPRIHHLLPSPRFQWNSEVAPGGAIFINCGPGEPCIDLHSSHTDISVDELAVLSFSIVNSLGKPAMLSRLILELPSGWSMDGEGFADKCSGLCSANYSIPTGEQEFIEVSAYPNHSGNFRLSGRIEWVYAGTDNILHLSRDVQIKVTAGASGNENRVQPLPTSPPRPPTAAPAAASPQQQPTAPPVGGTGPGGCNAPPPDARVLDPGLLLLAGLLFPGIAIRRIWKWKHGSRSSP